MRVKVGIYMQTEDFTELSKILGGKSFEAALERALHLGISLSLGESKPVKVIQLFPRKPARPYQVKSPKKFSLKSAPGLR